MKRSIFGQIMLFSFALTLTVGFVVSHGGCSKKRSNAEKITAALANRLTDALSFAGDVELKEGSPPTSSVSKNAPQITGIDAPKRFSALSEFKIVLNTDFRYPSEIDATIVHVENAEKYILVKQPFSRVKRLLQSKIFADTLDSSTELRGSLGEDDKIKDLDFVLLFALRNKDGEVGDYISSDFKTPDESPDCNSGDCCNAGFWVEAGSSCFSGGDESDCTRDVCNAEHACQTIPIEDGTLCNAGFGIDSGECISGVCEEIDNYLPNLFTEALEYQTEGAVKQGQPPESSTEEGAPDITEIILPDELRVGSDFRVILKTEFEDTERLSKVIVQVVGSDSYIEFDSEISTVDGVGVIILEGLMSLTLELKGQQFKLAFALQTSDGITGAYTTVTVVVPEDEPECGIGTCCNGGSWVPDGSPCLVSDGNYCTMDTCNSNHQCSYTNRVDDTPCNDGNADTVGDRCINGMCAGSECNCSGETTCCDGCKAINEGNSCDDGNLCTENDLCRAGACASGEEIECPTPNNTCLKAGVCQPSNGECTDPEPKPDGSACTFGDENESGLCENGECIKPPALRIELSWENEQASREAGFDLYLVRKQERGTFGYSPTLVSNEEPISCGLCKGTLDQFCTTDEDCDPDTVCLPSNDICEGFNGLCRAMNELDPDGGATITPMGYQCVQDQSGMDDSCWAGNPDPLWGYDVNPTFTFSVTSTTGREVIELPEISAEIYRVVVARRQINNDAQPVDAKITFFVHGVAAQYLSSDGETPTDSPMVQSMYKNGTHWKAADIRWLDEEEVEIRQIPVHDEEANLLEEPYANPFFLNGDPYAVLDPNDCDNLASIWCDSSEDYVSGEDTTCENLYAGSAWWCECEPSCAENASCINGECFCDEGYVGDPYEYCSPEIDGDADSATEGEGGPVSCLDDNDCSEEMRCKTPLYECTELECPENLDATCQALYPESEYLIECDERRMCSPKPCTNDEACGSEYVCVSGKCHEPDSPDAIAYIEINEPGGVLPPGAIRKMSATVYDASGHPLALGSEFAANWSSGNTESIIISAQGEVIALDEGGAVEILASVPGNPQLADAVTFTVLARAGETAEIIVTDRSSNMVLENAFVYQGTEPCSYSSAYGRYICPSSCAVSPCDFHVFHTNYEYVSVLKTSIDFAHIPLAAHENLGQVVGVRGQMDLSGMPSLLLNQDMLTTQAGFALKGDWMNHGFRNYLSERVETRLELGSVMNGDVYFSSGAQFQFGNEPTRSEFQIVTPPSSSPVTAVWGFGGRIGFSDAISILTGNLGNSLELKNFLLDIEPLVWANLWHGTLSSYKETLDKQWGTFSEITYLDYLPPIENSSLSGSLQAKIPLSNEATLQFGPMPTLPTSAEESYCSNIALTMVAALHPRLGLVPLGFGVGPDQENLCNEGDGFSQTVRFAPQHGNLHGFPYVLMTMAIIDNEDYLDSLDSDAWYTFGMFDFASMFFSMMANQSISSVSVQFSNDLPSGTISAPEFAPSVWHATFDSQMQSFSAEGVTDATFVRVSFSNEYDQFTSSWQKRRWTVYAPTGEDVSFSLPYDLEGADYSRISAIEAGAARLKSGETQLSYDDFIAFNDTSLANVNSLLESFSYGPVQTNACLNVICGQNAYCDEDTGQCRCQSEDWAGNPYEYCYDLCQEVTCAENAYCERGICTCYDGFIGDPDVECLPREDFVATIVDYGSATPVGELQVDVYERMTSESVLEMPVYADESGRVVVTYYIPDDYLPELYYAKMDYLVYGDDSHVDTYQFAYPALAEEETLWVVSNTTFQASPAVAGLTAETGANHVFGMLLWQDEQGEEHPVGCAKIGIFTENHTFTPEVRYFGDNGLPTQLANQDSINNNHAGFLIANVPPGEAEIQVLIEDTELYRFSILARADTATVAHIVLPYDAFPYNPGPCAESGDCEAGFVWADGACQTAGFNGECLGSCYNEECPGNYEMCSADQGECMPVYCRNHDDCANLWLCDGFDPPAVQWFGCDFVTRKCARGEGSVPDFCAGYEGGHYCCQNGDPCGWAENDSCDCGEGLCSWDLADCYDYCADVTCATHAHCEIIDYQGVCLCDNGFAGDGAMLCEPEHDCNETGHECQVDNTYCTTGGYCECNEGFEGDPYEYCEADLCYFVECGENAHCEENEESGICVCDGGFEGDPETLCTLTLQYCNSENDCPVGYPCHDVQHECRVPECDTTTECENRYPVLSTGDAAMECGEDSLCYPRPCRTDGECAAGFVCSAARCVKMAQTGEIDSLKILTYISPLKVGATLQLEAAAYDASGHVLPIDKTLVEWQTYGLYASVDSEGVLEAFAAGPDNVTASISGTEIESETLTVNIFASAEPDTVRVLLIDEYTGEPIDGANVYQGTTALSTGGDEFYTGSACPQPTCDYHVFHPNYAHVSVMKTMASDLLIPLTPNRKIGQLSGIRGSMDMSAYPEVLRQEEVFFTQSGFPMDANLLNHDFASLVSEHVLTRVRIGSVINEDMPLSSGYVGSLSGGFFREEHDIVEGMPSSQKVAWTLGGYADLNRLINLLTLFSEPEDLVPVLSTVPHFLRGTLWHGATLIGDLPTISGSWEPFEPYAPLYFESLDAQPLSVTEPTGQQITAQVAAQSSIPYSEGSLCPDLVLSMVAAKLPGGGLVPLGYSMTELEAGCTQGESVTIEYAPQHSGMDDYPYVLTTLALNLTDTDLTSDEAMNLVYTLFFDPAFAFYHVPLLSPFGSMSVYRGQAGEMLPPNLDAPPASAYIANAIWDPDTRHFTADGVPGESMARIVFRKDFDALTSAWERKQWIVYYPNAYTIDFTLPNDLYGVETTRLANLEDGAIEAQSTRMTTGNAGTLLGYDTLFEFNATNLDRMTDWLESSSYYPVEQNASSDPCESVQCGTNAHCVQGHCVCDTGYEGDPETECTVIQTHDFSATLINTGFENLAGIQVFLLPQNEETFIASGLVSNEQGHVYFDYTQEQTIPIDVLAIDLNDTYYASSRYAIEPYSQDVTMPMYEITWVQNLHAYMGLSIVESTAVVMGRVFWTDEQGEAHPIECAQITTSNMTGTDDSSYQSRVRYFNSDGGISTLNEQPYTSTGGNFIIANVPMGSTTFQLRISEEVVTEFTYRVIHNSVALLDLNLPYEIFPTNPQSCPTDCEEGQVYVNELCRNTGFSSCYAGCSNVDCVGTYDMCTEDNGECMPVYCATDADCYNLWQCDGEATPATQWFGCETEVNMCRRGWGDGPDFCSGYSGSHYCCQPHNPCGWAGNETCDCENTCSWDAAECGSP